MPQLSVKIPNDVCVSFSGGVDSVFATMFCLSGKKNVELIHFNHQTPNANMYEYFCRTFASIHNLPINVVRIKGENESEWREQRYHYLKKKDTKVITAHHADDNKETFLMRKKYIPIENGPIIRPFLNFTKSQILAKATLENWQWIEDPTNKIGFTKRNVIRNEVIPKLKSLGISYG